MRAYQVILYGSYGYTGKLIARECRSKKLSVLLSGRDPAKLKRQSDETGFPFEVIEISDRAGLINLLKKGQIVVHCGGPFQHTAKRMVDACLESQTHYTDITGEYAVFEMMATYDLKAKERGILIMSGVGFDVVPSDCLALHLKNRLPSATHLQLAFTMSKGGLSRGTAKTMVEGMGNGSVIRENGQLTSVPLGKMVLEIDFGPFKSKTLNIPWGDISTAWRSTGIPNIEVYTGASAKMIRYARLTRYLNWALKARWIKNILLTKIDQRLVGPGEDSLQKSRSFLWGRVSDTSGKRVEARLETPSGYLLTARSATLIAEKLLSGNVKPGYFTPAQYFGEGLISEVEGTRLDSVQ